MAVIVKPIAEINQQALRLLYRELGVPDAVRFLKQFTSGFGNYTQERDALFAGRSVQQIVDEIEQQKGRSANTP
ncbi:MAG: hypothetical protein RMM08_13565 [Armatimonadota bacterium]|nr:hypothetical protein [bacterium]MDW8322381.1 hypothetical protein [Armatimonadota bacterium]